MSAQSAAVVLDCLEGKAGQIADCKFNDSITAVATADLIAGRIVLLAIDSNNSHQLTATPPSTTVTLADENALGIVVHDASKEFNSNGNFQAGDQVAVLRKGRIFANIDSDDTASPPTFMLVAKVHHSSTTATKRGLLTTDAAVTTAGSEVTALTKCRFIRPSNTTSGVALVEIGVP